MGSSIPSIIVPKEITDMYGDMKPLETPLQESLSFSEIEEEPIWVWVWPDGMWVYEDDATEAYLHNKSDDYLIVNISNCDGDDDRIEEYLNKLVKNDY